MAVDEHVAILNQGRAVWNEWRLDDDNGRRALEENYEAAMRRYHHAVEEVKNDPNLKSPYLPTAVWMTYLPSMPSFPSFKNLKLRDADLSSADLSGRNLNGYWLRGANLYRSLLRGTQLNDADLRLATLARADLSNASLINAALGKARCQRVIFDGADLSNSDMTSLSSAGATFIRTSLRGACISNSSFQGTVLDGADLQGCTAVKTNFSGAKIRGATFQGARLSEAFFKRVDLSNSSFKLADLTGANLEETNLSGVTFVSTNVAHAILTGAKVHGVSAWDLVNSETARQQNLRITSDSEPEVTVDNIEVAQFLYLMLNNQKIRGVIDTITSKVVLILGRFTPERKAVLDFLREELRKRDLLPILFDFDVPDTRDVTETISLLARMARFIIADLTNPSSIPKELEAIVPGLAVPVQPLIEGSSRPYSMFKDYWKYDWVLPVYRYEGLGPLLSMLVEKVIAPAEAKAKALQERRPAIEAELSKPR